ncbi:Rpn family recombination-promoting nuclease/putative transposase [Candidatus Babeliales bacterium]|nr:Rpn family recombination-promoting nuclease/putative transposase [Candidatus Babeliales bacterium]
MASAKFLLPTADTVFKRTFGNKAHKNVCIDFLNNVLDRPEGRLIVDVEFLDTYNQPKYPDDRQSILDIRCTDQEKKTYIIEVQVEAQKDFGMRSQYYVSRVLADQLSAGSKFSELTPVILVGILDFTLFTRHNRCVTHHVLTDTVDSKQDLDLIEMHFIELTKFKKNEDELTSELDKWIFFLKDASRYLDLPQKIARGNKAIADAFEIVSRHNWTKLELEIYEKELDNLRCWQSAIDTGIEKGREEGLEIGIEKTARAMLSKGFDLTVIAEITGLDVDQIKNLK